MFIPFSYLKSVAIDLWNKEYEVLDNTSKNKFRTRDDVNEWLFRHWQLMSGQFEPRRWNFGILMSAENTQDVVTLLKNPKKFKMICINDSAAVDNFDECKATINQALQEIFPKKSIFEK